MSRSPYEALIEWFARNTVAANLLMAILLAGGLFSVFTIKKESQPTIDTNFIDISMPFLGASPEDIEVTKRIVAGGEMMDIEVLDHIIIGDQSHVSMKDRRLGFESGKG